MTLEENILKSNSISNLALFCILSGLILFSPLFLYSTSNAGNLLIPNKIKEKEKLRFSVGETKILVSKKPIKRIFISEPSIAKHKMFESSSKEIFITGKSPGITTLAFWHKGNGIGNIYTLVVEYDLAKLKQKLHSMFPQEKELKVIATHDSITLSGRVSNAANLSEILAVTQSYAKKDKVNNLVEVGGVHQVMLEVRVAEMSRNLIRKLGVNLAYLDVGGSHEHLITTDFSNLLDTPIDNVARGLFNFQGGDWTLTGLIDVLKTEGMVQVLAEPTLIALNGQTANFLAGGEFPVPVDESDDIGGGGIEIEWKEFGVGLSFTPRVLNENKINLKVQPEVSQLDFSSGIQVGGVQVPGLTTRRASTTVELGDGQSFAIAGLLQNDIQDRINKFPWLGDIPVLGNLFKSRSYQQDETELVIVATPHLVKPIDAAEQTLPTDYYREPTDKEFYILGMMQGRDRTSSSVQGELDGDFGHALPDAF